jgi:hypothetical protein
VRVHPKTPLQIYSAPLLENKTRARAIYISKYNNINILLCQGVKELFGKNCKERSKRK